MKKRCKYKDLHFHAVINGAEIVAKIHDTNEFIRNFDNLNDTPYEPSEASLNIEKVGPSSAKEPPVDKSVATSTFVKDPKLRYVRVGRKSQTVGHPAHVMSYGTSKKPKEKIKTTKNSGKTNIISTVQSGSMNKIFTMKRQNTGHPSSSARSTGPGRGEYTTLCDSPSSSAVTSNDCILSSPPSFDYCEEEEDAVALKQINKVKKHMIGASEFDVLEKLIDLNAPKHVLEFQMRRVEDEENAVLVQSKLREDLERIERECEKELAELESQPMHETPKRSGARRMPRMLSRKIIFDQPPTNSGNTEGCVETDRQLDENCVCEDYETKEKQLIKDLEELLESEYEDVEDATVCETEALQAATCTTLKVEGKNKGLGFRETVEKGLAAAVDKFSEREEMHPETAAAMLHSEEKGVRLSKAPREVFETLFPEAKDKVTMEVMPAQTKTRDVVPRPTSAQTKQKSQTMKDDAALLNYYRHEKEKRFTLPTANQQDNEGDEDDLMGTVDSQVLNEEAATFKVILASDTPINSSQVQMRGSQPPFWFPGYYVALPNNDEIMSFEKPWTVLEKAWQTFRPTKVKPKKGVIIIGT